MSNYSSCLCSTYTATTVYALLFSTSTIILNILLVVLFLNITNNNTSTAKVNGFGKLCVIKPQCFSNSIQWNSVHHTVKRSWGVFINYSTA